MKPGTSCLVVGHGNHSASEVTTNGIVNFDTHTVCLTVFTPQRMKPRDSMLDRYSCQTYLKQRFG
jgi:hypothetical protein